MSRAMLRKACDPNYVPEPIYPEYIPLEDEHDGDDDDGDSSGDDIEEDENEDDEEEEEEEEHLALADFTIIVPVNEPIFLPEGT
ncbi:hypothetical protein Tco_0285480 [Tanacetum coccineum]